MAAGHFTPLFWIVLAPDRPPASTYRSPAHPARQALRRHTTSLIVVLCLAGLVACGGEAPPPTPTLTVRESQGRLVFQQNCAACHALTGEAVIVGPALAGIAGRAGDRVAGQDATQYLVESILAPGAFLVEGFDDLMPTSLGKELTGEELDAVIAYLLTLR